MRTNKVKMRTKYGESELTEEIVDLTVPGADSATFVHITDLHIAVEGPGDSEETKELVRMRNDFWQGQSGYYSISDGVKRKLFPHEVCDIAAERIREISPDAVFFTGDAVDFPSASNFRAVRKYRSDLGCPCVIVPGNHDVIGDDETNEDMICEFNALLGDTKDFSLNEICGIDVLGFADGFIKITSEQVDFLEERLKTGRKVIILLHAPIFTESARVKVWPFWGYNWMIGEETQSAENRRFRELLFEYRGNVAAILSGHVHLATGDEDDPSIPGEPVQFTSAPAFFGFIRVIRVNGG